MEVRSLGYRTDLMIRRLTGSEIEDVGNHLVVRTPHNPHYYWGNFLLYADAPRRDDARRWLTEFGQAFPDARHVAIGVDGTDGDLGDCDALREAGLEPERAIVLVADDVTLDREPTDGSVELRPLVTDSDWQQAMELQVAISGDDSTLQREFVRRRMGDLAQLTRAGAGVHVGAFVDGTVRAALGLYTDGSGIGRYQLVETHPDFRRRGYAAALLPLAADLGRRDLGITTFVIIAEPDYFAVDLYRRAGFRDHERQVSWERRPDSAPPVASRS